MLAIYISTNSFLVSGDSSAEFIAGRRVKADCGVDGVKYASVVSATFSTPNTTVVINENVLTSNLSTVLYGIVNVGAQGSFPDHNHSSEEGQGGQIDFDDIINKVIDFNDLINNDINFLQLTDTPTTYSGSTGVFVKTTASGLEFVDEFVSKVKTFLDLDDTPSTYADTTGLFAQSTGSGVVWAELPTYSGGGTSDVQSFLDLTDTPSSYTDTIGQVLISTGSGIEFSSISGVGSSWYYGDGEPSLSTGLSGDFYIDNNSGTRDYYKKFASDTAEELNITSYTHYANNSYGSPNNMKDNNLATYCQQMSYIAIDFGSGNEQRLLKIQVAVHNSTALTALLGHWFQGSNDSTTGSDGTWDDLVYIESSNYGTPGAYPGYGNDIIFENSTYYRWYRIGGLANTTAVVLNEWKMFGVTNEGWTLVSQLNPHDSFIGLTDTPTTYSGMEGKYLKVTTSGIVFDEVSTGTSDVQSFLDLTDTPTTYSGVEGKYLVATSSGITFSDIVQDDAAYGEIYRTTSKSLTAVNTWHPIEFDTNGLLVGMTHSTVSGTEELTVTVAGVYEVSYEIQVRRNSGNRHLIGRLTNNSSEIIGSASTIAMISTDVNDNKTLHSNVITTLSSGDVISVEIGTNILYPSEIDVYTGSNLPLASQNIYAKLRLKKLSDGV